MRAKMLRFKERKHDHHKAGFSCVQIANILDRDERLDKLKLFRLFSFCLCAPAF